MYMCRFMFSQSRSDSEEKNWGVWREKTKKKKKNRSASLCSAATTGCVQVSRCVCMCPQLQGRHQVVKFIPTVVLE